MLDKQNDISSKSKLTRVDVSLPLSIEILFKSKFI